MQRKQPLEVGEIYHVMDKSIAGFKIFNTENDCQRMMQTLEYFSIAGSLPKFSYFLQRSKETNKSFEEYLDQCFPNPPRRVQIIAYCLMPTHFHLVLKPLKKNGASQMLHDVLNSYAKYFNVRHKRNGRFWAGPFKNVLVESDEQLRHLTRYVHLNPVTGRLRDKAEDWQSSSYREYITPSKVRRPLCQFKDLLDIKPRQYRKFVEDQIDYQRHLATIKKLLLE